MVLNMTELSIAQWSNTQLDAARKLCTGRLYLERNSENVD